MTNIHVKSLKSCVKNAKSDTGNLSKFAVKCFLLLSFAWLFYNCINYIQAGGATTPTSKYLQQNQISFRSYNNYSNEETLLMGCAVFMSFRFKHHHHYTVHRHRNIESHITHDQEIPRFNYYQKGDYSSTSHLYNQQSVDVAGDQVKHVSMTPTGTLHRNVQTKHVQVLEEGPLRQIET